MALLAQFLLRLSFGLAVGMAITSPKQVSSGYFRNHLYVTLGLATLAALASFAFSNVAFAWAIAAAVASYVGSVGWLYEKKFVGVLTLFVVAACAMMASLVLFHANSLSTLATGVYEDYYAPAPEKITETDVSQHSEAVEKFGIYSGGLGLLSNVSSGLLLGLTVATMLLGHWYLNSPGMELAPLRRLILAASVAVALQAIVSMLGLAGEVHYAANLTTQKLLFLTLRWSFGMAGVAVLLGMAWQTLKVPNTQSATGILFVAVIAAFIGELTGLLLSAESAFPL